MTDRVRNFLPFPAFLTDFYEVTMAYGYWKTKRLDLPSVFTLYFRTLPFEGGYAIAAGLDTAADFLETFHIGEEEIAFLAAMKSASGAPLFEPAFFDVLRNARFSCDVEAVPEGVPVFANEPLVRVKGPIWQCQWIETALLNIFNFQTLIATKAARVVQAAKGTDVLEFGLRRSQGPDGGLAASRAAYIGGVSATSNVLAGKLYGIPLRGTHAHSWVMSFDTEEESFRKFTEAFPDDSVLLVDTFNTHRGVQNAITIGKELKKKGKNLAAIRLDSGDLAYLSNDARTMLDQAGLQKTRIIASNELDEHVIQSLHHQNAKIDTWGVGTKLVTAYDQPALNGVYKLVSLYEGGAWKPKIKVSDHPAKTTNPGIPRIRRYLNAAGLMEGDLIFDESEDPARVDRIVDPVVPPRHKKIRKDWTHEDILTPVFTGGKRVLPGRPLVEHRERTKRELAKLHPGITRLENPHVYPVGLSPSLSALKQELMKRHLEEK